MRVLSLCSEYLIRFGLEMIVATIVKEISAQIYIIMGNPAIRPLSCTNINAMHERVAIITNDIKTNPEVKPINIKIISVHNAKQSSAVASNICTSKSSYQIDNT